MNEIKSLTSTLPPIGEIKADLLSHQNKLNDRFQSGDGIEYLLEGRSDHVDHVLTDCWQSIIGLDLSGLSLVATGGYGRAELHPYSDIDLLIIFDEESFEKHKSSLELFSTFLWDIGLKPGLSVRTIEDCIEQAKDDITVITNLMESRLITGSERLFNEMKTQTSAEHIWPAVDFFHAKVKEQTSRHLKFGDTAYNLEPDMKEGPGGLRDIQNIQWITQRYFGSNSLGELINHAFLTKNEYRALIKGQKFLWQVRFALHSLAKKPENRLLFDYQKDLALIFDFEDSENNLAVESFMQLYYQTVMDLERINELILQVFNEAMENKTFDITPINESFRVVNKGIEITHPDTFKNNPSNLLDIFFKIQKLPNIEGVRSGTIRQIREDLHLIDDDFRQNKQAQKIFLDIIRHPHGITHQFRRMNRYGVLGAYIPAFKDIVGRMQYDLFHAYTVDQHTLFLVRNLRRFALDKHKDELPHCNEVYKHIQKPELLYLAGLFHDIAKGRGGNHATLGKVDAIEFCQQHNYNEYDATLVGWVVEHHLIMSMTAQKKDIDDPFIIHKFASKVGSLEYLDYLYLLTVADMKATNPSLWNNWKASLLKNLYTNTQRALRRGLSSPVDNQDETQNMQHEARLKLNAHGLSDEQINNIWSGIDKDYFSRFSVDDSIWHTLSISSCSDEDMPMVLIRPQTQRGGAEIFVYSQDQRGMFAVCTATLDQLGLNILDARIITTDKNIALVSFHVLESNGEPIPDLAREQSIANTLRQNILNPENASLSVDRHKSRQTKHFDTETSVTFSIEPNNRFTIMEIVTHDKPGVLSTIGECFSMCDINIRNAKVATIGSQAEDIFFISDSNDKPITDQAVLEKLEALLIERLI